MNTKFFGESNKNKFIKELKKVFGNNVETTKNKVTKITENSTDEQYPSAKAVYTTIDEKLSGIETLLASI